MAIDITNENIDEYITSFVDNQENDPHTREAIGKMVGNDEMLSKKYKSELLTKEFLRARLSFVEVPQPTYFRIATSIDNIVNSSAAASDPAETNSFILYLRQFLLTPLRFGSVPVPRYAVGLVLVASVLLIGFVLSRDTNHKPINPYIAFGSDKNVMVQAVNNFHKILSGEIKPQMESRNIGEVSGYLKQKVNFEPMVPELNGFQLLGCVCDQFEGEQLAHLVYGSGDDVIYIFQADINSIRRNKLEIPEPVNEQIAKDRYYMCDHVDQEDCTLLLWYFNNVLCASVSNLPKQHLYNKLITAR
jgi:hypothetical protein